MLITCNRILLPTQIEEDDAVLRDARLEAAGRNIRRRRCTFHLGDVEKFTEHEDKRFVIAYFYANDPWVIDLPYDQLEAAFRDLHAEDNEDEDDRLRFWIPAN